MAKKKSAPKAVKNAKALAPVDKQFQNGLSEAIMGFNPGGFGNQISQTDTIFKNLRFYLISNMRQALSEVYAEKGLCQTLVDVPVDDALRGRIQVKSKQLTPDEIELLITDAEAEGLITEKLSQGLKWNRLYGGAGIIVVTDQDPATPLNLDIIPQGGTLDFVAVDMWELYPDRPEGTQYTGNLQIREPEYYTYYGVKLDKSRVFTMRGITAPSFIRPRLRGWGLSVIEGLVSSINQYLKNNELAFEVLDEFKVDVFKIKGLTDTLLSADGSAIVQRRLQLASQQKNFNNGMAMDAEDDYQQKQVSFTGLAEMMKEFRIQIASDTRMPMTKLFGLSASGFNSGEDDIEVYNGMVEGQVRAKAKKPLVQMLVLKARQMFGKTVTDLSVEFPSLRMLSSEQEQKVKDAKLKRVLDTFDKGLCSQGEAKESINKDDLVGVQLDIGLDTLPTPVLAPPAEPEDVAVESPSVDADAEV